MSFLIDAPWLYASGRAYAARTQYEPDHPGRDAALAAATMAVFWGVSVSLYLDKPWTRPIWRACRARSGRDWMVNSGVLRLDHERESVAGHLLAGAIFASYPVFLWRGMRHGR
jgi:hypothetical protein